MTILILQSPATNQQIVRMSEIYEGVLIKLAVDVRREVLSGGCALHADCEHALLENGSLQEDIWGADWYPDLKRVGFESLINIRPWQRNFGFEIKDAVLRQNVERIVLYLFEGS